MARERTFSIIKPDATRRNLTGKVNAMLEAGGLRIVAQKRIQMTTAQAEAFYGVHQGRPFFPELVSFMTSGPCMPLALGREDAVPHLRTVIGATDPAEAAAGTIRKLYAESKGRNAIPPPGAGSCPCPDDRRRSRGGHASPSRRSAPAR
jgi:nucleoside-diphosphate kinase